MLTITESSVEQAKKTIILYKIDKQNRRSWYEDKTNLHGSW